MVLLEFLALLEGLLLEIALSLWLLELLLEVLLFLLASLWLLLLGLILSSLEHIDEVVPAIHEMLRVMRNILGHIAEELVESGPVSSVAGAESPSVVGSFLLVFHNNKDRLN